MKSFVSGAVKTLLALGILYWLMSKGFFDTQSLIKVATPENILIFLVLGLINAIFVSERARLLIARQVAQYKFFQVFKLTILGFFFNFAMPGGVGGDVIKGVYLVKNNASQRGRSLLALLMDRVIGLYCMIFLAVFVMTLDYAHVTANEALRPIYFTMSSIGIFLTIGLSFCFHKSLNPWLHRVLAKLPIPLKPKFHQLIDGLADFGKNPKLLFKACAYSILSQSFAIIIFYVVAQTLGFTDLRLLMCFTAAPIGFIVTALPITPGGVGLGQAVFFYIFELYLPGSGSVGTTAITVLQAEQFLFGLWGAFYFIQSEKYLTWSKKSDMDTSSQQNT